ncbi:Zn-dependent exopeptidase [Metschnikowia bicuspidata var. bicuspidata NRRL YB-4993]|uniref:Zn-dependent exopeptidase n=1 Tax=Metschnikowia bicuspidata var. bicuspidata NRRL YB-4993 TaxID=869754 RepID=A0A1A0HDV6_9ASCO|nr:Zn-dependent exopeptidase [Metschnikowia bicuspidata var. bicuspidata NRRL YB-4993]OBA22077.1 Zn-dependent exopeptidase [Metschnikowia bicuspidata var. bicuspidata NRRL YB-4993]
MSIMYDAGFRNQSAAKLAGAVRIQTHVTDSAPSVDQDPAYWHEKFAPFHDYLQATFPELWRFCQVEKVNSWGLVITWPGSDAGLRPLLLGAHQDVVPIQEASLDQWTYPPFEGVYDGTRLWGRGSADCKNLLIGLLEAAEALHAEGFRPRRTVVFAFGFDEEIGGDNGARNIGLFLLARYGPGGFYAVFDEGGQSLVKMGDVALALIGTSQKGSLNYVVSLNTPGGHSSVPPDHTAIGIVSELVTRLENAPFLPMFTARNPTFAQYQCLAAHSAEMEPGLKRAIRHLDSCPRARQLVAEKIYNSDLTSRYLVTTSQAVDIIHGGVKSNALPEYVEVLVNHRIAVESSVQEVLDRNMAIVGAVADRYGLGIDAGGSEIVPRTQNGHFSISYMDLLEPAPATPVYDEHWALLAGTLRHVYEEVCEGTMAEFDGTPILPVPGMAPGNTDSKHYWDLSKHIYRYRPGLVPNVQAHAHGADEHIVFDAHLQIIAFYYEYIQLADWARD